MWEYYRLARSFTRQVSKDNISAHAAAAAFFLFLSMIPLLMLLCAMIPYTPITEAMLMQFAVNLVPPAADSLMVYLIGEVYDRSGSVLSLTAVVTVWIAAKGMLALMRGLDAVNESYGHRNYFLLRFKASLYTFMLLLILLGTIGVLLFGKMLMAALLRRAPELAAILTCLIHFRFLLAWLLLSLAFALLYTYIPQVRYSFHTQLPGAVCAAVAWSGFSWGFSLYISCFQGLHMYGRLTTIIIVLLWLYFGMYLLLVGAKINFYLRGRYDNKGRLL